MQLGNLRLHVFGHIHEAHGAVILTDTSSTHPVIAVNAALAREGQPIVVDLKRLQS